MRQYVTDIAGDQIFHEELGTAVGVIVEAMIRQAQATAEGGTSAQTIVFIIQDSE